MLIIINYFIHIVPVLLFTLFRGEPDWQHETTKADFGDNRVTRSIQVSSGTHQLDVRVNDTKYGPESRCAYIISHSIKNNTLQLYDVKMPNEVGECVYNAPSGEYILSRPFKHAGGNVTITVVIIPSATSSRRRLSTGSNAVIETWITPSAAELIQNGGRDLSNDSSVQTAIHRNFDSEHVQELVDRHINLSSLEAKEDFQAVCREKYFGKPKIEWKDKKLTIKEGSCQAGCKLLAVTLPEIGKAEAGECQDAITAGGLSENTTCNATCSDEHSGSPILSCKDGEIVSQGTCVPGCSLLNASIPKHTKVGDCEKPLASGWLEVGKSCQVQCRNDFVFSTRRLECKTAGELEDVGSCGVLIYFVILGAVAFLFLAFGVTVMLMYFRYCCCSSQKVEEELPSGSIVYTEEEEDHGWLYWIYISMYPIVTWPVDVIKGGVSKVESYWYI